VVALNKFTGDVKQRIATTERIIEADFQRWLHFLNKEKYEIYVSMNTIRDDAHGRKKTDIAQVRHLYLDFDNNGTEAVRQMMARSDMPKLNHLIESSPGKWQAIWKVRAFEPGQAEDLMRGMVREFGADPAATDTARVLRLPGFRNHKYQTPNFITVRNLSTEVYTPSHFPRLTAAKALGQSAGTPAAAAPRARKTNAGITQSERDWAYAKRALTRGEDPQQVIQAIAAFRTDKPNPQYYAEHTVQKARSSVDQQSRQVRKTTEGVSLGLW
jgi:hypothetical protein